MTYALFTENMTSEQVAEFDATLASEEPETAAPKPPAVPRNQNVDQLMGLMGGGQAVTG